MSNQNETNEDVLNFDLNETTDPTPVSDTMNAENIPVTNPNIEEPTPPADIMDALFKEPLEDVAEEDIPSLPSKDDLVMTPIAPETDLFTEAPIAPETDLFTEAPAAPEIDLFTEAPAAPETNLFAETPAAPETDIQTVATASAPTSVESLFSDDTPLFTEQTPIMEHSPDPVPDTYIASTIDDMKPLFDDAPPATADSLTPDLSDTLSEPILKEPTQTEQVLEPILEPVLESVPNEELEPTPQVNSVVDNPLTPDAPAPAPSNDAMPSFDQMDDLDIPTGATHSWQNTSTDETTLKDETSGSDKKDKKDKKEKKIKESKPKAEKPNKPKKKWPIVLAAIFGGLLIIALIIAYLLIYNPVTSNSILSTVLKPKLYYGKTELNALKNLQADIDKNFDKNYALAQKIANTSIANESTLTLGEGAYDFAPYLGNYATILSSIKTITFKTDSYVDESKISYIVNAIVNDKPIVVLNAMLYKKTNTLFLQAPALSTRWFQYTLTTAELASAETNLSLANDLIITGKDVNHLLDTYLPVIIHFANDITINKKVTVDVDNTKSICNEAVVKFKPEELQMIIGGMLTQAKSDNVTFDICKQLGLCSSQADLAKAIDAKINSLKENKDENAILDLTMSVYIDKTGKIIGRKFIPNEKSGIKEISFYSLPHNDVGVAKYSFTLNSSTTNLMITGNNKLVAKNKNQGSIKVNMTSKSTLGQPEIYDGDLGEEFYTDDSAQNEALNNEVIDNTTLQDGGDLGDNTTANNSADNLGNAEMQDSESPSVINNFTVDEIIIDDTNIITNNETNKEPTTTATPTTDTSYSINDTDDIESVESETKVGFVIDYKDFETNENGLMTGNFTFKLEDMPAMINPTIKVDFSDNGGFQKSDLTVDLGTKNLFVLTSTNAASTQKDVTFPPKAIDVKALMSDKVLQYNLLLEVNVSPTVANAVTAFNNKVVTLTLAQILKQSGLVYFNGKQTPLTLYYMGKANPAINAIFLEGYKATKAGTNPGLDAQMVQTGVN